MAFQNGMMVHFLKTDDGYRVVFFLGGGHGSAPSPCARCALTLDRYAQPEILKGGSQKNIK